MAKIINKNTIQVEKDLNGLQIKVMQKSNSDVPIAITGVEKDTDGNTLIHVAETLDKKDNYLVKAGNQSYEIAPSMMAIVFSTVLAAALVNNYVFTKYLGLCVFFGTSKKRDTAVGMGFTFTIVAVLSGFLSWLLYAFIMSPLKLKFLEIIVFIGVIAFLVQASDTIMKKINPTLHRKFGIYLVLITTNCIILAVPLLNASTHAGFGESLAHAMGAGLGFALALFLMSCAREKAEIAPIPEIFKGLPIAFIIAGLFALSFLGFSGLKLL